MRDSVYNEQRLVSTYLGSSSLAQANAQRLQITGAASEPDSQGVSHGGSQLPGKSRGPTPQARLGAGLGGLCHEWPHFLTNGTHPPQSWQREGSGVNKELPSSPQSRVCLGQGSCAQLQKMVSFQEKIIHLES